MHSDNRAAQRLFRQITQSLLLMVILALGLRIAGMLILRTYNFPTARSPFATTPVEFSFGFETGSIAASLARGHGFSSPFGHPTGPTAWIAPIYPALLAALFKIFGVYSKGAAVAILSLNSLFSALVCIPIVLVGRRTFGDATGLLAGWIWALVPVYMKWPIVWVWDTTLSAFLMAFLFLFTLKLVESSSRKLWAEYGLLWGGAALTNPALLSILPCAFLWVAFQKHRAQRSYLLPAFLMIAAFATCTAPWMIRNAAVMGKPVFIRDNFWFEFHLGNYHLSNAMGWGGKHPTLNHIQLDLYRSLGEVKYIEHFRAEGLDFVGHSPGEFAQLTLRRIAAFWNGGFFAYTYPEWWELPAYVIVSCLSVLGLLLALGNRMNGAFLFAIVLLCYPIVYYFTYPGGRYRYPIEPEMVLLSSYFLCELAKNMRRRFSKAPANIEKLAVSESALV
jgi:4-amino-4-deoxy-L-arabinose transferase-like glycosyltransferase